MGNKYSSSTESYLSDSDPWELKDVKLLPYMSTFIQESQENVNRSKKSRRTKFDYQPSVTLGDEYVDRAASTLVDKSNLPEYQELQKEIIAGRYLQHVRPKHTEPTAFKTGCLLPEFPELRDSYDQFCTSLSANSSNEDLEVKRSLKYVDDGESSFSRYPVEDLPDEVHVACKRRKRTILEEASDAHEKFQRWSMPEFTKLWYDTLDSDTERGTTEPTGCSKEHVKQHSDKTSQGSISSGAENNFMSSHLNYTDLEEQISGPRESKEKVNEHRKLTRKESASCPNIVRTETSISSDDHNFGFCDTSTHGLFTSTPKQTDNPLLVNTTTENNHCTTWRETEFHHVPYVEELSDGHDDSTLESSSSNCEASVCTSDSGYSGMSNGTRESPEGESEYKESHYNQDNRSIMNKPELYRTLKDLEDIHQSDDDNDKREVDRNYKVHIDQSFACDHVATSSHTSLYPDVIVEKRISEVRKSKHCARLVNEFRVIKNLHPGTTTCTHNYSLYRTYEV